ncbi:MAG: hypothetical protein HND53_00640 [Proteobacteria bacterium]|nr:hypothetical protein [Pseudomonadota bacterium]NOG58980.1 hypothetical protein [Pseudomonadota bacterium]
MSTQIIGYYNSRKEKLLRDFDRTTILMKDSLNNRYGSQFSKTLQSEVRHEYEKLIPDIPFIKGIRARMLNTFLLITAQELAVYKAMKKQGKSSTEAWELCHQALRLRVAKIPQWKRWLLKRFMFSSVVKNIFARRARQQENAVFGDFEIKYLIGGEEDFDFGVNYIQCGNHNFMMKHGGEEFSPYVCMSDIALSDAMEWGLMRTQTLADGCDHCDFRFKKGAETKIHSKTPEVQVAIESILNKEAKRSVDD